MPVRRCRPRISREARGAAQRQAAACAHRHPSPLGDARYPRLLRVDCRSAADALGAGPGGDADSSPAIALVGSRAATPYALAMARRLSPAIWSRPGSWSSRVSPAASIPRRMPRRCSAQGPHRRRARLRGSIASIQPSTAISRATWNRPAPSSANFRPGCRRCRITSRCATASSAACRWRWSSSKRRRRAARSLPRRRRPSRAAT